MKNFIKLPDVTIYKGYKVDKNTKIEYETETLKQTLNDLEFIQVVKFGEEKYECENKTTIHLNEGDVVVFESEERGYIVPLEKFTSISEAIEELNNIKDLDERGE